VKALVRDRTTRNVADDRRAVGCNCRSARIVSPDGDVVRASGLACAWFVGRWEKENPSRDNDM
jgi:hypothetical protein